MRINMKYIILVALVVAAIAAPALAQTNPGAVPPVVEQAQKLLDDAKKPANEAKNDDNGGAVTLDDVVKKLNDSIERAQRLRPEANPDAVVRDVAPAAVAKPSAPVTVEAPAPATGSELSTLVGQLRDLIAELRAVLAEQKK